MAKRLQRNEDLRIADLRPAAAAEIVVQRIRNFILAGEESLNQALQLLAACEGGGIWIFSKSCSLAGKSRFYRRGGDHGVGTHRVGTAFLSPPSVIISRGKERDPACVV